MSTIFNSGDFGPEWYDGRGDTLTSEARKAEIAAWNAANLQWIATIKEELMKLGMAEDAIRVACHGLGERTSKDEATNKVARFLDEYQKMGKDAQYWVELQDPDRRSWDSNLGVTNFGIYYANRKLGMDPQSAFDDASRKVKERSDTKYQRDLTTRHAQQDRRLAEWHRMQKNAKEWALVSTAGKAKHGRKPFDGLPIFASQQEAVAFQNEKGLHGLRVYFKTPKGDWEYATI